MPSDLVSISAAQPLPSAPAPPRQADSTLQQFLLILLGTALTLSIHGYTFGKGNHTIYLLDALRGTNPQLLQNDWFCTQTLQYHALFGAISAAMMRWNIIEQAFAVGYLTLIVLFHVAWLRLARQLAGTWAYVAALLLFYLSAAGTGLGFYQFFQDSSFLPSNIANVAMLWALCLWIGGRFSLSGACFGLAGAFHLNHAIVGIVLWVVLVIAEGKRQHVAVLYRARSVMWGSALIFAPSLLNILFAAHATVERSGAMPMREFLDLYVRLRHPHHYDPASWPAWLWLAFAWPMPIAVLILRRSTAPAAKRASVALGALLAVQFVAMFCAGVGFVSETVVHLSLWRFGIFAQLVACTAVAGLFVRRQRISVAAAVFGCVLMIAACSVRGPFFGAVSMPEDDTEYLELCDWAREHTPIDALFVVPPSESAFRLRAQRAIVVNFKAVPQLSGELHAWRDRLCHVLHVPDLQSFPRGYPQTLDALRHRYDALTPEELLVSARRYQARFIVATARFASPAMQPVFSSANETYFLYDLTATGVTGNER